MLNLCRLCLLITICCLFSGCTGTDPRPAFADIAAMTQARTGHSVVWRQNTVDDQQADNAVDRLLHAPLTVEAAVQIALLNNQGLQTTYEDIGISQADLVQAGLLKNPSFSALLRFPDQPPSIADLELSVAQDFLDLFTLPLRRKVAAAELEQTQLEVGAKVIDLTAEVKEAFYSLQADQELLKRLKTMLDMNQSGAELAEQQHTAGTVNELDEQNQEVIYDENRVELAQAQVENDADREKLNRLMGLEGAQLDWNLSGKLPEIPDGLPARDRLETLALNQRLDVAAARHEVERLREGMRMAGGTRYLPGGVEIGGDTEKNPDGSRVTGPTLSLQVPIFDQGQAQIARAVAEEKQAEARLKELTINAGADVREAWNRLEAARTLVQLYRQTLLPRRMKILQLAQQQYNYMLKGTYDLLEVKERELETERSAIEAAQSYWLARAQLERAVGGTLKTLPVPAPVQN